MRPLLKATTIIVASFLTASAQQPASDQPAMNARDVFWSASDLVGGVHPNPGQHPSNTVPAPLVDSHPPRKPEKALKVQQIDPKVVAASGYGAPPTLVRVAAERLGIRYTILKKDGKGGYSEVLPTTSFHNNDHVKISAMGNAAGYLYLIQQGSSGTWSAIFPSAGDARDSNRIVAGQVYQIPSDGNTFEFTGPPGEEKLFIVFSRQPINDLDDLIFGLRQPTKTAPAQSNAGVVYETKNAISDDFVQRLASRDLTPVQEQVIDPSRSGDQDGEKAVYVVTASTSSAADSRVIARLELNHR
jgi:hypothetical protein